MIITYGRQALILPIGNRLTLMGKKLREKLLIRLLKKFSILSSRPVRMMPIRKARKLNIRARCMRACLTLMPTPPMSILVGGKK